MAAFDDFNVSSLISEIIPELPPRIRNESLLETYGSPIGNIIGQGTYGKVYVTDKNFAVKITSRFESSLNKTDLAAIVYPVCLHHPNIIKYNNVYIGNKDISIVMSIYQGDVVHMAANQPGIFRNMDIFKSLAAQMISAVAYLTSRGIIHLDIKPPNILYQYHGPDNYTFVLADFDIAQDRRCEVGDVRRFSEYYTEPFRPPELFQLDNIGASFDESADVWALGVTLGSLYMNKHLFWNHLNPQAILTNIPRYISRGVGPVSRKWEEVAPENTFNPSLKLINNVEVDTFLRKMLQFEPTDRVSIFELQYDSFIEGYSINLIEPTTCIDRIMYFDRRFDFSPLLQLHFEQMTFEDIWHKTMSWCLEIAIKRGFNLRGYIMSIELFARYMLLNIENFPQTENLLIICAAMYIGYRFSDTQILIRLLVNVSTNLYTGEEIIRKSEDLLTQLNFDLCAKTSYDDICRFRSVYPSEILDEAVELLSYSSLFSQLYFDPNNAIIILCLCLQRNNLSYDFPITDDEIEDWRNNFINNSVMYNGPLINMLDNLIKTRLNFKNAF